MRLKHTDNSVISSCRYSVKSGPYFCRMMSVIVKNVSPAIFSEILASSVSSSESGKPLGYIVHLDTAYKRHRKRRCRIKYIMLTADRKLYITDRLVLVKDIKSRESVLILNVYRFEVSIILHTEGYQLRS